MSSLCHDAGTQGAFTHRRRGGPPRSRNTGRPPPRSRSELAGSSENGRGYEPRLKRQRTVLYDRLAWTSRPTNSIQNPPWDGGTALGRTAIRTRSAVLTHRDPSPGVFRTPVSREVGQHWGMSRLRSRHAFDRCPLFSDGVAWPAHLSPPRTPHRRRGRPPAAVPFPVPWRESRYPGVRFAHRARDRPDETKVAQALPTNGVSCPGSVSRGGTRCSR